MTCSCQRRLLGVRYIRRNTVELGLVEKPEGGVWSNVRWRVGGMGGVQVSVRPIEEGSADLSMQRSVVRGRCHPTWSRRCFSGIRAFSPHPVPFVIRPRVHLEASGQLITWTEEYRLHQWLPLLIGWLAITVSAVGMTMIARGTLPGDSLASSIVVLCLGICIVAIGIAMGHLRRDATYRASDRTLEVKSSLFGRPFARREYGEQDFEAAVQPVRIRASAIASWNGSALVIWMRRGVEMDWFAVAAFQSTERLEAVMQTIGWPAEIHTCTDDQVLTARGSLAFANRPIALRKRREDR